jgi:hypothetical protein
VVATVTINPASVVSDNVGWVNTGGAASKQAAVSDASDATYIAKTGATFVSSITFGLGASSLPDGAGLVSIAATARAQVAGGSTSIPLQLTVNALKFDGSNALSGSGNQSLSPGAFADLQLASVGSYNGQATGDLPKDVADRVQLVVTKMVDGAGGAASLNVAKLSAVVSYVRAPTPTSQSISGVTTTTRPTLSWTITDTDSIGQYAHQAVVWATADQANFPGGQAAMEANPDYLYGLTPTGGQPSPPAGVTALGSDAQGPYFTVSGTTYQAKGWTRDASSGLPGWKLASTGSWNPDQDLPISGSMKAYNRLAALHASSLLFVRGTAGYAATSFTMAVTPPNAATSITPVWQYPGASSPNNTSDYRMKLDVVLPSDTISRRVKVERQVAGTNKWALLPVGAIVTQGTGAATLTFYDTAASPNKSMQYRVTTGVVVGEVWGTPVLSGTSPTATFDQLVLRDPTVTSGALVVLRVLGDLELSAPEVLGFTRGLGASLPVAVSDAIVGDTIQAEVYLPSEADYQSLKALRAKRATLLLQGDMPGWYRWVRLGEDWGETILRSAGRKVDATRARRLRLAMVETWPIAGQPLTADWGA